MARRRRYKNRKYRDDYEELPRLKLSPATKRGILIVVFVLLAVVSLLAFFDAAGSLGTVVNKLFTLLLGWAAVVTPLIFVSIAVGLFLAGRREEEEDEPASNLRVYLGAILLTLGLTGILHLLAMRPDPGMAFELVKTGRGGGYFGVLGAFPLFSLADFWVSVLVMVGFMTVSVILMFNLSIGGMWRKLRERGDATRESDAGPRGTIDEGPRPTAHRLYSPCSVVPR